MEKVDSEYFMSTASGDNEFYVTPEVKFDFEKNG